MSIKSLFLKGRIEQRRHQIVCFNFAADMTTIARTVTHMDCFAVTQDSVILILMISVTMAMQ